MTPDGIAIEDLLPHRDGMLLIDEILAVDTEQAVTRAVVSEQWPLFSGQGVSTLIAVELVAQTAGICNGWVSRQRHGDDFSRRGWLVGVKKADFAGDTLPLGSEVVTTARNGYKFESFREASGTVRLGSQIIARVTLQLFQPASEAAVGPVKGGP